VVWGQGGVEARDGHGSLKCHLGVWRVACKSCVGGVRMGRWGLGGVKAMALRCGSGVGKT
jgi:hypothetical protein